MPSFEAQQATLVLFACFNRFCHNQVTLRCLIFAFFMLRIGDDRAAALKPAWGFHPQTPSSLRGGLKGVWRNQVTLRCLILVGWRFALCGSYVWGAAPSPAEGESPSDSHLRFAAV